MSIGTNVEDLLPRPTQKYLVILWSEAWNYPEDQTTSAAIHKICAKKMPNIKDRRDQVYRSYHGNFINSRLVRGLCLADAVYASGQELPKHSHRNAGFCLVLQGSYEEAYGRTLLDCKPSSVKFQPAAEEHSDIYGSQSVRVFIVELQSEWLQRMDADRLVGNRPQVYTGSAFAWLMMKLRGEFQSMQCESPLLIEGLVLELVAETYKSRRKVSDGKPPLWLEQAREFISEEFAQSLSLSAIAKLVGVHPVYLANSFRRHYRQSIGDYVRHRRIEFACHRILTSNDSLVEIALASGFADQSHFSRTFKRVTRMSPTRYRATRQPS